MGKSRPKRSKAHRSDPVARHKPPPTDPELARLRETKILPVINDLKGPAPKQRTTAAAAIANIIQDEKCRKLLLREQVVHTVLTETLTDNSLESRAAGWEILKVLALEEESDFCVHLHRLDVLTAAEFACKWVFETLRSTTPEFSKVPKAQQHLVWSVAGSLASLLGKLAETQDEILQAVTNTSAVIRFLFMLVSLAGVPAEVLTEALSCLLSLSEDNRPLCEAILNDRENSSFKRLTGLSEAGGLMSALSCGVLHNLFSALEWHDHSPGMGGACDAVLIPPLSKELASARLDGDDASIDVLQVALEVLASIATSLQLTLEKGNKVEEEWNGFADQDAHDDVMDEDGGSDEGGDGDTSEHGEMDDEMDDDEILEDMDRVTGLDHEPASPSAIEDLPTLSALIEKAVPPLIRLTASSPASEAALVLQTLALAALNNLAWTISCLDFTGGENAAVSKAWSPVGCAIWREIVSHLISQDTADVSLATLLTNLSWALARSLGGNAPVQGDEHRKFISLYKASRGMKPEGGPDDPFQGLGVKCIGVLGQLARDPSPMARNREIGIFLITVVGSLAEKENQTPAADVIEALEQLFDVYGDETLVYDREAFWRDNFLAHLEEALPRVKAMAKSVDKRKSPELRDRADEAATNLARFIQYKRKNRPKA